MFIWPHRREAAFVLLFPVFSTESGMSKHAFVDTAHLCWLVDSLSMGLLVLVLGDKPSERHTATCWRPFLGAV